MTPAQLLALLAALRNWHAAMELCEQRMDELAAVAGPVVESPLGDAVYGLMSAYTSALANAFGFSEEYLTAWWNEHQFGGRPMSIGFNREPLRTLKTIDDLAAFIAEDLERSAGK